MRHRPLGKLRPYALLVACLGATSCDDSARESRAEGEPDASQVGDKVEETTPGAEGSQPDTSSSEPARDSAAAVKVEDSGRWSRGARDGSSSVSDAAVPSDDAAPAGDPPDAGIGTDCAASENTTPRSLMLSGNLGSHDPSVLAADGKFYLFETGRGVPTKTSSDLLRWTQGAPVFASNPSWIAQAVQGATDLWAPDISSFGGKVHLYYSVSTFGSNRSCIGHATRETLTSGSFRDEGSVVCSNAGNAKDDWNAIDPNVVLDEAGTPWMSFGSFWSGIKLVKLTPEGKRADNELIAIAGRRNGGAIEAPYIVRRCDYYYLFVSWDKCCAGADSTYRVMVGRSRAVTGPYVDRMGVAMLRDGGTQVVAGGGAFRGPGHNAVLRTDKGDYNIYHAYGASDGRPQLRISELTWDSDGWPVSGGP